MGREIEKGEERQRRTERQRRGEASQEHVDKEGEEERRRRG